MATTDTQHSEEVAEAREELRQAEADLFRATDRAQDAFSDALSALRQPEEFDADSAIDQAISNLQRAKTAVGNYEAARDDYRAAKDS